MKKRIGGKLVKVYENPTCAGELVEETRAKVELQGIVN